MRLANGRAQIPQDGGALFRLHQGPARLHVQGAAEPLISLFPGTSRLIPVSN